MKSLLEICCDSEVSAKVAELAGADRIELCDNLAQGGITPSWGKVKYVKEQLNIPVFVLIRPRKADFLYSASALKIMLYDIEQLKDLGVDGFVSGALNEQGHIDLQITKQLVDAAGPLPFTFHRAFDMCADPLLAIEQLADLGVKRILSSGQFPTAQLGKENLAKFAAHANGRISIMACGELLPENIDDVLDINGIYEYHAAVRKTIKSQMQYFGSVNMGDEPVDEEFSWMEVDPELVKGLKQVILQK